MQMQFMHTVRETDSINRKRYLWMHLSIKDPLLLMWGRGCGLPWRKQQGASRYPPAVVLTANFRPVTLYRSANFCCVVGIFNKGVNGNLLLFTDIPSQMRGELQFLLLEGIHHTVLAEAALWWGQMSGTHV